MIRMSLRFGFILLAFAVVGCGGRISTVTGRATIDDLPLADVGILLWPTDDPGLGVLACRQTDAEGLFEIHPEKGLSDGGPGTYKIVVTADKDRKMAAVGWALAQKHLGRPLVPFAYTGADTTPLEVELRPGVNEIAVALESYGTQQ